MTRDKGIMAAVCAVAVVCTGFGIAAGVVEKGKADTAHAELVKVQNEPPKILTKTVTKTVTQNVPVFGASYIYGAYAAGTIQGGGVWGPNGVDLTPSDNTCSQMYVRLTQSQTAAPVDRPTFMTACESNIDLLAKSDPGK